LREKRKIILEGAGADPFSLLREKTRKNQGEGGGGCLGCRRGKKVQPLGFFLLPSLIAKFPPL
jgi:hypothetical protein